MISWIMFTLSEGSMFEFRIKGVIDNLKKKTTTDRLEIS